MAACFSLHRTEATLNTSLPRGQLAETVYYRIFPDTAHLSPTIKTDSAKSEGPHGSDYLYATPESWLAWATAMDEFAVAKGVAYRLGFVDSTINLSNNYTRPIVIDHTVCAKVAEQLETMLALLRHETPRWLGFAQHLLSYFKRASEIKGFVLVN